MDCGKITGATHKKQAPFKGLKRIGQDVGHFFEPVVLLLKKVRKNVTCHFVEQDPATECDYVLSFILETYF